MQGLPFTIFAKSALDMEQLVVKQNIGCDGIEYQLLTSNFTGDMAEPLKDKDSVNEILESVPAAAVHVPMAAANIEDTNPITALYREQAILIANQNKQTSNRRPLVVVHTESSVFEISKQTAYLVETELDKSYFYANVDLVIENTTPFRNLQHGKTTLSSGYFDAPVQWVRRFGKGTRNRLGTCLDICHAMITEKYMLPVFEVYGKQAFNLSLNNYFELYADSLKLIHLANFNGNGYGSGFHGTPFRSDNIEDMSKLELFCRLYEGYFPDYSVPITIEINELDLLKSDGYIETLKALYKIYGR